jgi:adenylosuccinate synthase
VADFPADIAELDNLQPEYEWHEGWRMPTGSLRRLQDLPRQARAYLARIEELSGVPLRYVSVGTRRDQIIEV